MFEKGEEGFCIGDNAVEAELNVENGMALPSHR